jgi:YegS/Rv2252/BmrU family lipid kinase
VADAPYPRVHVVINPASGKDEPILNTLNDVFHAHGVDWDVSITKKYGDAKAQAKAAIEAGCDLVAGYGGDGTQHEIANAVVWASRHTGRTVTMGVLPGGTGNGFARELGIPKTLRPAVELLCTSTSTRSIDVGHLTSVGKAEVADRYFVQRCYIGIEPEEQTSREEKDKYGVFAYAVNMAHHRGEQQEHTYKVRLDDETAEVRGTKVYLVNSGMMGTGLRITHTYAIDDGLLDCFVIDNHNLDTIRSAVARLAGVDTAAARRHIRQARHIEIDVEPDQPIWTDGEYIGRTPLVVDVLPGALTIAVA